MRSFLRRFILWCLYFFLRLVLRLRYRIQVRGLDTLTKENLNKPDGILFLANHPAEIDPLILFGLLWPEFRIHPIAIDYLFRKGAVRYFLELAGALSIPSFDVASNSYKRRQIEKTFNKILDHLKHKENLLIYPAGGLKNGPQEVIGGASGVHSIVQKNPDANVVLIRTRGLWGSSFSRAITGKTPDLGWAFLHGFKTLLKNFIFFVPRREIEIEVMPAPSDFPWTAERRAFNRYLENWFNYPSPEPLNLVSYSFYKEEFLKIKEKQKAESVSIEKVPEDVKKIVFEDIAKLSRKNVNEISKDQNLSLDLGLDSLDVAQIVVMLRDEFGVQNVNSLDLPTVEAVLAYAAGFKKPKVEEEEKKFSSKKENETNRPMPSYPDGKNLLEVFLKTCERMDGFMAAGDQISGEVSYRKLKFMVLLLADAIRKIPGDRIGILMPASIAVNATILATLLAKKVPVMINWTLGSKNLKSVLEQSKVTSTLSSWNFLNRLENIELDGFDEQIILLEDIKSKFSIFDMIKAYFRSKKSRLQILKTFKVENLNEEDLAVILFTSGTESTPKGVPLSHRNLISNQKSAFKDIYMEKEDVFLGILPPFHSFGFSVTGLLPFMIGLFVAFSPNPTDGRQIARATSKWKVTILCMAPTFLKNLLRVAKDELASVRLVVLGAEKTASELFEKMKEVNPEAKVIEGYGITECAPILTLNYPDMPAIGVGKPLSNVSIQIVNEESFEPLPKGKAGLILASGPNVFHGYIDPKIPSPFMEKEGKVWYKTGDLGFINDEGFLTLSGRLKRFAKIGGEMISLASIEETLIAHAEKLGWKLDPNISQIAVVAKEQDGKKGELHLFTTFDASVDEVNRVLKESGMSNLIKIRAIHSLRFIPLLGTGKIDYRTLSSKLNT